VYSYNWRPTTKLEKRDPTSKKTQRNLHHINKEENHSNQMPPKKDTVSRDEFNALKREIEQRSQMLVNQLQKQIADNEKKYMGKIEELKNELNEIKYNYNNLNKKQQQRAEIGHISEMTRPSFYGSNRDIHPVDFLHRLDEYFAIKQLHVGEKIVIVGDCLKAAALS